MMLQQKGTAIIGTYQYTKVGKDLGLEGSLRGKDSLVLSEYDPNGKQTGIFKGVYKGATAASADLIEGVWSTPNGSKSLPFSVRRMEKPNPVSTTPAQKDNISGRYKRAGKHGAEVVVKRLKNNEIEVEGEAFWQGQNDNIHTGDIKGVCSLDGNTAKYTDQGMPCKLTLTFGTKTLTISGDDGNCGGLNVTFNGTYKYIGLPTSRTK